MLFGSVFMTKANTQPKNDGIRQRDIYVCLFLVISTLFVFWPVLDYGFVNFDDGSYVTDNRLVQSGLTLEGITWAFTTTYTGYWHPLTWLSHMLDCQIYGMDPGRHHLTSVLFHIANSLLLFFVFKKMTRAFWPSAFTAALFALHPLHVESVAWISERKDVLSTFFWMLTMWSYVWYVQHPRIKRYLLVLLCFVLGLMVKPMLMTLPFVLLLLDYYPLRRFQQSAESLGPQNKPMWLRLVLEKIPMFVLVVIEGAATFYGQKVGGTVASLDNIPFYTRVANGLVSYAHYLVKMIYPAKLAVLYPHPGSVPSWQVAGACLLLVSISVFAILRIKRSPYFVVGWLWYLGTLVPTIGLIQVGVQSMADRYTYIPLIGVFMIIAWGTSEFAARWCPKKRSLPVIAAAILLIYMTVARAQIAHWENSITLFDHTLQVTARNWLAHNNLGIALKDEGRINEAIQHYEEALRIMPDYAEAHNNLGFALYEQGRVDDAIRHYEEALRIKPDLEDVHNNLGNALQDQGRIEDAIRHYEEALRIKPDYAYAHNNLGNALQKQHRIDDAIKHYEEALRIRPDYAEAYNSMGIALFEKGDTDGAIIQFRKALQLDPDHANAQYNLGQILMMQKQGQ